jgi:two-component system C4-dicarboxylate transport sensor histidine kinase DctB
MALELLQTVKDEVDRTGKVVRRILSFVQDGMKSHPVATLVEQAIDNAITLTSADAKVSGVKVIYLPYPDSHTLRVMSEDGLLEEVLVNLITNAIRSILRKQSSDRIVTITPCNDEDTLYIDVSDTGEGFTIPPREAFEPFMTTDPSGTGLGLSTSKRLIHSIGGSIHAMNTDTGATIRIQIPLLQDRS